MEDLNGFTLAQLAEGYKYHLEQDCPVSQHLAADCLKQIAMIKGQRAAKIRKCLGLVTASKGLNGGLEVYEDLDSEPMLWIKSSGDVCNVYAKQWQLDIINAC